MADEKCGEPAVKRVFWPGREPLMMCERHASMAVGVSQAMGVYLHTEAIGFATTCQHAKGRET